MKHLSIFISHSWKYNDDYKDIRNLLKENNIPILDFSVTRKKSLGKNLDSLVLEEKLNKRIKRSDIFIISTNPMLSKWVEHEVLLAHSRGIYILGVRPKNVKKKETFDPHFLKLAIQNKKGKIINFNKKSILKTIAKKTGYEVNLKPKKRKRRGNFFSKIITKWLNSLRRV